MYRPSLPHRKYSCYTFLLESESTRGPYCRRKEYVNDKSKDTKGNQTRDLLIYSAGPQPTATPCAVCRVPCAPSKNSGILTNDVRNYVTVGICANWPSELVTHDRTLATIPGFITRKGNRLLSCWMSECRDWMTKVRWRNKYRVMLNPLTPELNPSAQRCLTGFFTGDFFSWTVYFVNICVKNQQIHQLFIQFINYVW
jgi:hypothetical protein